MVQIIYKNNDVSSVILIGNQIPVPVFLDIANGYYKAGPFQSYNSSNEIQITTRR